MAAQWSNISSRRQQAMLLAVELEVDAEEFGVHTIAERRLWEELVGEFEDRVAREGRSWVAAWAASGER